MKKFLKCLAKVSILFLQICCIPNTNSNFTNIVFKMNDNVSLIFGQKTAIILFVDFLDMNLTIVKELIEQQASNMTSYFSQVSYDKMLLKVDIANETFTLPQNMSFFANVPPELARDSILQADPKINYHSYAYVLVVHAGQSKQRMAWANDSQYIQTCAVKGLHIQTDDGKIIDSCAILSEYDSLRSFCHETAHLLGLPDLCPGAPYTQGDVGCWDLMGIGRISQEFYGPPQLSAWSRIRLGWINSSSIKTVNIRDTRDTSMLHDLETFPWWRGQTKAIKVAITPDSYYLAELRNQILSDRNLPSSGILIYRCDESASDYKSHSTILMDLSLYDFQTSEERKTHSNAAFDDNRPLFCDPVNGIAIEVFHFDPSASIVTVYRQQKLHTLKLALPQSGVEVTVDNRRYVSDKNGQIVAIVLSGNHTVTIALPPSPFYTITSLRWSDGDTSNPREIQVLSDATFACFYSVDYLPLIILVLTVIAVLVTISVLLLRRRYERAVSGKLASGSS